MPDLASLVTLLQLAVKDRTQLALENIALRHQLAVYKRSVKRPNIKDGDRIFWLTVMASPWVRKMSESNPLWGAPKIHGELLKLGINVSQPTVSRYMVRRKRGTSQTWKTFVDNHVHDIVAIDFFTVPTVTFRVLYVFVVLSHVRREILHVNVTEHPTAAWTARQILEAFPGDVPRLLLRDRDSIYGWEFDRMVKALKIRQIRSAPRSPWQNPFVERVIGSIRRECTDHVIPFGRRHLLRVLREYVDYYNTSRPHQSLDRNSPIPRDVEAIGDVCAKPVLGGLHHRYFRAA